MDKYEKRRLALMALRKSLGAGAVNRIAEAIDRDATYISRMLAPPEKAGRKRITEDFVELLDAAFPGWLPREEITGTTSTSYDINVESAPNILGTVPLISWVQAGVFCLSPDLFQPGDAEDWVPCVQKLGPHAYALRVKGDSMTSSYGRSYPEGCLIFVDPDAPITNGCRVIAKLPGTDETTFKVYVEDAGKKFLRPLNPQYPTIEMTADMALCGVVRGYYMPE